MKTLTFSSGHHSTLQYAYFEYTTTPFQNDGWRHSLSYGCRFERKKYNCSGASLHIPTRHLPQTDYKPPINESSRKPCGVFRCPAKIKANNHQPADRLEKMINNRSNLRTGQLLYPCMDSFKTKVPHSNKVITVFPTIWGRKPNITQQTSAPVLHTSQYNYNQISQAENKVGKLPK